MTRHPRRDRTRAFSLVELVIVVTIIGVIASIAVPRISTAASRASANALEATVNNVRKAIDVYYAEHGRFPGYDPGTGSPAGDEFVMQLLAYSDYTGNTAASLASPYIFGPYLRPPFPTNPANKLSTVYVKATPADADPAADAYGWVAVLSTGDFGVHATDAQLDDMGIIDSALKEILRLRN
jgi:prepilin-type N-terminal cleavage/methylation domain-containing protein